MSKATTPMKRSTSLAGLCLLLLSLAQPIKVFAGEPFEEALARFYVTGRELLREAHKLEGEQREAAFRDSSTAVAAFAGSVVGGTAPEIALGAFKEIDIKNSDRRMLVLMYDIMGSNSMWMNYHVGENGNTAEVKALATNWLKLWLHVYSHSPEIDKMARSFCASLLGRFSVILGPDMIPALEEKLEPTLRTEQVPLLVAMSKLGSPTVQVRLAGANTNAVLAATRSYDFARSQAERETASAAKK